ncbi:hypothetical protein Q3G72_034907 [Acer saccharum]|nr:hypothetical protein Q3G72_034907 [Acer saccharum]
MFAMKTRYFGLFYEVSTIPEPSEAFKADVRLPWTWTRKYVHVKDDNQLQEIFKIFKEKGINIIRMNIELIPIEILPPLENPPSQPITNSSSNLNMAIPPPSLNQIPVNQ